MTSPTPIEHPPPILTPEAVAAGVVGPASVRCALFPDGTLHGCELRKPIPSMKAAILRTLSTWRYTPATTNGDPVTVQVDLSIPLIAPTRGAPVADAAVRPPSEGAGDDPLMALSGEVSEPTIAAIGDEIQYTDEARRKCVEGTMIVKCTLTREGRVTDCDILKTLPEMDAMVLAALPTRRYKPALYHGEPIAVMKVFIITLTLPPR
jgi:TonB family protein